MRAFAVGVRQDRCGRASQPGSRELGWELVSSGGTRSRARRRRTRGHRRRRRHRVLRRCSTTGSSRCTRRCTAGSSPTARTPTTSPTWSSTASSRSTSSCRTSTRSVRPAQFQHGRSPTEIELIDIGGPAMVRAAAKNHAHVGVVVDLPTYDAGARRAADRRRARRGHAPPPGSHRVRPHGGLRRGDRHVVRRRGSRRGLGPLPPTLHLALEQAQVTCATARTRTSAAPATARIGAASWWDDVEQHGGLDLSYLNLYDAEAAWRLCPRPRRRAGVAIIKHANPCGVARRRRYRRRVPAGLRVRRPVGVRRHRRVQPAGRRRDGRAHGRRRAGRRGHRPRLRRRATIDG